MIASTRRAALGAILAALLASVPVAPFISLAAWWNLRRVRSATADFRRATFYALRGERALIASGMMPAAMTKSGVPVMPKLPPFERS